MIESNGKKLYWNWEHRMRTNCREGRQDLTLEDLEKKTILLVNTVCPMKVSINENRRGKGRKVPTVLF